MKWGGKQDSERNICGPFDWTQDEERITLQGWEGWLAVREPGGGESATELPMKEDHGLWSLYFDEHDDGAGLPPGMEALEVTIKRTAATS
jgi:hypothetical protein